QMPIPPKVKPPGSTSTSIPTLSEDLGEELDITDLLNDPLVKPETPDTFDLGRALGIDMRETRVPPAKAGNKPPRSGFASLLESNDEPEARTVMHSKKTPEVSPSLPPKGDDWQMQTRPYDRKTLQALTSPAALKADKPAPKADKLELTPERSKSSMGSGSGD